MNHVTTYIRQALHDIYPPGELRSLTKIICCDLLGQDAIDYYLGKDITLSVNEQCDLESIVERLKKNEPIQYIQGETCFYGSMFRVAPGVLIPRPETEELVDLVLKEKSRADLRVLDIGTGSGAIAISLKAARPNWQVTASDISADALQLAKENALKNQVELTLIQSDVFSQITERFDMIISNPPYIAYDDEDEVGINVLASEPHLALFADENGFAIYRQIIENASEHLTENGKLYFEIGYKQGEGLRALLSKHFPAKRVRVIKDMFGKDRMVVMDND